VPFAALPSPTARAGESLPLIREHEILHEPSVSAVVSLKQGAAGRQPPSKMVAVFADPVFSPTDERLAVGAAGSPVVMGGKELPRLRNSREEAKNILALSTPAQPLSRLDFEASKTAAEDPQLALIELCTLQPMGILMRTIRGCLVWCFLCSTKMAKAWTATSGLTRFSTSPFGAFSHIERLQVGLRPAGER
jgi:hypothetical protein